MQEKPTAKSAKKERPLRQKRNADETRRRILETATTEFAAEGYNGARIDVICEKAKTNPRMIYHYFGDKSGLYVAVLERVLGDLRREELKIEVDDVEPLAGILQLFNFIHEHFRRHPELLHLLSGENLLRARFLGRSAATPLGASPLVRLIEKLLRRGQRSGLFRKKIDAVHLYVTMVALSYFHRSNAYTLSVIFQTDLLDDEWQEDHHKFGADMLERFLLATPKHPSRTV